MTVLFDRRRFNKALLACLGFLAAPMSALARDKKAFEAKAPDDVLRALFGDREITPRDDLKFLAPEIAEDGSIVPVTVSTDMPAVKSISLVVDANPNPLSARFHFAPGAVAEFKTRIKMGDSSDLRAVIETDDALYVATRHVKVTLGGCGG